MDRMKKLLMMDSRTFNRMTTPNDKVLTSIEGEMSSISNDESIPEDVRAKLFTSKQSRFLKIEHPQWGETANSPDVVLDNPPRRMVERGKPVANILKSNNRASINVKKELPVENEDIKGSDETELCNQLWTPNDIKKASLIPPNVIAKSSLMTPNDIGNPKKSRRLSRSRESSIPPRYGTVKTPSDIQSRGLSYARESSIPPIYVTPGLSKDI